jgi:hypothetical protein
MFDKRIAPETALELFPETLGGVEDVVENFPKIKVAS